MNQLRKALGNLLAACVLATLAACGGGSGGENEVLASEPAAPAVGADCSNGAVARLAVPERPTAGRNVEVGLQSCAAVLTQLQWTQVGGPSLPLMSARSQALSLEPAVAGVYRFAVSFQDERGQVLDAQVLIDVAAGAAAPGLVVRGEPSVWAGGELSLRAWPVGLSDAQRNGAQVRWSVVDGPATTLAQPQGWSLVFSAPSVNVDSLLRLRATASLADGSSLSQDFTLLVQPPPQPAVQPLFADGNAASRVYAYQRVGPHASALEACIYAPHLSFSNPSNLCTLGQLPLLGQVTRGELPTVEQVMQRVLVSNDWMGDVFENFLRTQDVDGDFRRMLNATTAIVIGSRIRPSFYWSVTGAIYLDASSLWLTPDQRDTLSEAPDPRSNFGAALNFNSPWRYVLGNRYAVSSFPIAERGSRDLAALRFDLGRTLYHELAHAGDFLPPRIQTQLRDDLHVFESSPVQTTSLALSQQLPFTSAEMAGLARVQFLGVAPSAQQIAYTPDDISAFFSSDRVNDDYNYSIAAGTSFSREDLAMLVEEAMMQLRFGVFRDFAITDKLGTAASSADLPVRWGQRGRIGEAAIRPRVALVLNDVMPWIGAAAVTALAPPLPLRPGLSWGINLDQAALAAQQPRPLSLQERRIEADQQQQRSLRREQNARIQSLPLPADRRGVQ
ncbi:MAG: hypothetical protein ABI564_07125 [Ideonella sp.]